MTNELFTYEMFNEIRSELLEKVMSNLSLDDKKLIISFAEGNPLWNEHDYSIFPGINWKLINIKKLRKDNFSKFTHQINLLKSILEI